MNAAGGESINKLFNILCEVINKGCLAAGSVVLINDFFETLKIIGNCAICNNLEFQDLINEIENHLAELEKEEQEKDYVIFRLDYELLEIEGRLNFNQREVLCESCKEKDIKRLTNKCGNEEMARFLYECRINIETDIYIKWIPFNEFKNIEYLAKGGFGEVHKATWICYSVCNGYKDKNVVLKRIYNSDDKITDILKEVKKKFFF